MWERKLHITDERQREENTAAVLFWKLVVDEEKEREFAFWSLVLKIT